MFALLTGTHVVLHGPSTFGTSTSRYGVSHITVHYLDVADSDDTNQGYVSAYLYQVSQVWYLCTLLLARHQLVSLKTSYLVYQDP